MNQPSSAEAGLNVVSAKRHMAAARRLLPCGAVCSPWCKAFAARRTSSGSQQGAYGRALLPGADGWGDVPFDSLHHRAIVQVRELAKRYENSPHLGGCIATMGNPSLTIRETAIELAADLIVVGSHARSGVKHLLLGSVAEHVIREATCPVVVVRGIKQAGGHVALPDELEQTRARRRRFAVPVSS